MASAPEAIIVDRGYRHWDGTRGGSASIRWAITGDAIRRALGLGRRARAKIFPWSLLSISVILAIVLAGMHVLAGTVGLPSDLQDVLPGPLDLFSWQGNIALLFVAVVGPTLLIPDRTNGTLSLYFSRPLTLADYLRGKALAYTLVVGAIYFFPQLVLWIGQAAVAPSFGAYLGESGPVLWQAAVGTLAYLLTQGAILAVVSTAISRTGFAAAAFLGTWVAAAPIAGQLSRLDVSGIRLLALLNLPEHPVIVTHRAFGVSPPPTAMQEAGFDPWVSVVVIVVLAALSALVVVRRYRRLT